MTTPKLVMPELSVSQASKEITHNQALAILDQISQATVVDKDLTAPPGSPANGSLYIVAAGATGAWTGQSGKLAFWLTSVAAWTFITPTNGWSVWVTDESVRYEMKSGVWVVMSTGGATLPVVQALSSTRNLALADINTFNVNSTVNNYTVTIPPQSSVVWTADAEIHFLPSNTGDITITGGTGVSVNGVVAGSLTLSTQNGAASIKRIASDSWWVGGITGTTAEQRTALGLGSGDSPTFTALTLGNGQIVFPATQVSSANANTLDDYEEGTWTPTIVFDTIGDLSVAYSVRSGTYTKIGRAIALTLLVRTSTFTYTTASGVFRVSGVPFPGDSIGIGASTWRGVTKASYTNVVSRIDSTTTNVYFMISGSGQAAISITAADMPTGGPVEFFSSIVYNTST